MRGSCGFLFTIYGVPLLHFFQLSAHSGTIFDYREFWILFLECVKNLYFADWRLVAWIFASYLALSNSGIGVESKAMSRTPNDSEDGLHAKDHIGSPLIDDNSGGSGGVILKKGPWTSAEDAILVDYVKKHGEGNWNAVQKHSGLSRCGKSCRLRWANHLRPNLKKGAFTQEEERLIIELHAKMGNKWARMAAHLPGRTDNEIKNYWNTRIKRRQRAGLPLYPPELCSQAFQESQQGQNTMGINTGDRDHDFWHANSFKIPDVMFDSLKANQGILPYVPGLPDISQSSMLMKSLSSAQCCSFMPPTMHRQKRLRESMTLFPGYIGGVENGFPSFGQLQDESCNKISRSFGLSSPLDSDTPTKSPGSFGVIQGSHTLSNGNFSASKPMIGAVKLELPSLQYPETNLGSWDMSSPPPIHESIDAFIQSPPPSEEIESDGPSPRNSGLLDALLHEAKNLSSAKYHSSEKSSNSSTVTPGDVARSSKLNLCETEWDEYGEPLSPLGHSATSLFSECTPISASASSLDEQLPADTLTGCHVKTEPVDSMWAAEEENGISTKLDITRPDVLLASSWFERGSSSGKNRASMTDAIATLLGEDLANDYRHMSTGTSSSQGCGLGSCSWNNMPAVCQMSELP